MAYFMVRVELPELGSGQKPTWDDYNRLHVVMQQHRYYRVIQSDKGVWYHLPHANYSVTSDSMTRSDILNEVVKVVNSVWSKAGKLVTEGPSNWEGLKPASASEVQQLTK